MLPKEIHSLVQHQIIISAGRPSLHRGGSVRHILMKKTLFAGITALFLTTGTAHAAEDTRKWIWRCAIPHTPNGEQLAEAERCCKRWPNAPNCNGDYTRAMSLPRCAKLPHLANIKCAERILEEKKKNARSH